MDLETLKKANALAECIEQSKRKMEMLKRFRQIIEDEYEESMFAKFESKYFPNDVFTILGLIRNFIPKEDYLRAIDNLIDGFDTLIELNESDFAEM